MLQTLKSTKEAAKQQSVHAKAVRMGKEESL